MHKLNAVINVDKEPLATKKQMLHHRQSTQDVSQPSAPAIRVLTSNEDVKPATNCLAAAFANDPISVYLFDCPDTENWPASRKWNLHLKICEAVVKAHLLKGLVLGIGSPNALSRSQPPVDPLNPTADEAFDTIALWMPPGANMDDEQTMINSGLNDLRDEFSSEGWTRFNDEFLPLLHVTKAEVLGDRDEHGWYLVYLGTAPHAQGRGLGKRVVKRVTDDADKEGRPCYLESSSKKNLPLYERWGFELKKQIAMTRAEKEVEVFIMVREPKGAEQMAEKGLNRMTGHAYSDQA